MRGVLARSLQRRPLRDSELIFAQGAPSTAVYCLSRGLVALRSYRSDGSTALVRLVYPGDIFGFRSFLEDTTHETEAMALVPSRVCMVARREARQIVACSPRTLERIARRCAEELARARHWQQAAGKANNRQRLARLILDLAEGLEPGVEGPLRIRLPLSRHDMAAALGVAPETVSRLLGRLCDDEVLKTTGRWVEIETLDRLRKVG
jgi:CRP/FNR family transcriptional regulator